MPNLTKADKSAKLSATQVRLRKETALMEMREFELAEKRKSSIDVEAVSRAWATIGAKLQTAVLGLPSKCAEAAAHAKTPREAEAVLRAECESLLRTLSDELLAPITPRG